MSAPYKGTDVKIWDGTCTFLPNIGMTPFGFYDDDAAFQADAIKVARFCASRLGYPLMDVELQSGSFFTCFEEAVTTYGNTIYEFKVKENYLSLEGGSTAFSANNTVLEPSLHRLIEIARNYGTEAEVGGNITLHKGILKLKQGVQDYDLDAWAEEQGIVGGIEIRKVFYEAPPAILRYFDPYAGTGTGIQSLMDAFDFGSYSPGVNFLLMPISHDLLTIQAIEFNDQVRKSAYSFQVVNNKLKLFPIPPIDGQLRIEYYSILDKQKLNPTSQLPPYQKSMTITVPPGQVVTRELRHNLGSTDVNITCYKQVVNPETGETGFEPFTPYNVQVVDGNTALLSFNETVTGYVNIGYNNAPSASSIITNVSEVPYENPVYSKINSVGRQWIFNYTLALAREVLAYVRGKYTTLPIPDSEATLNQADLLADARSEKDKLVNQLREMLEGASRKAQLEMKSQEAEYLQKSLSGVPMVIYIG